MVNAQPEQLETYPLSLSAAQVTEPPSAQGLQLLYDIVQTLAGARSLREGLHATIERIARADRWDLGVVWLNTPAGLRFQDAWSAANLPSASFLEIARQEQQRRPDG